MDSPSLLEEKKEKKEKGTHLKQKEKKGERKSFHLTRNGLNIKKKGLLCETKPYYGKESPSEFMMKGIDHNHRRSIKQSGLWERKEHSAASVLVNDKMEAHRRG